MRAGRFTEKLIDSLYRSPIIFQIDVKQRRLSIQEWIGQCRALYSSIPRRLTITYRYYAALVWPHTKEKSVHRLMTCIHNIRLSRAMHTLTSGRYTRWRINSGTRMLCVDRAVGQLWKRWTSIIACSEGQSCWSWNTVFTCVTWHDHWSPRAYNRFENCPIARYVYRLNKTCLSQWFSPRDQGLGAPRGQKNKVLVLVLTKSIENLRL